MTNPIPAAANPDLNIPDGLDKHGLAAVSVVRAVLDQHGATWTGGCRAFYTPAEWTDRGESYGKDSLLIIVHDGGDVGGFFNYDKLRYERIEAMNKALERCGLRAEPCTSWYTAIYATSSEPNPTTKDRPMTDQQRRDTINALADAIPHANAGNAWKVISCLQAVLATLGLDDLNAEENAHAAARRIHDDQEGG